MQIAAGFWLCFLLFIPPAPRLLKCVQHVEPNFSPFIQPAEDLKNWIKKCPVRQIQQVSWRMKGPEVSCCTEPSVLAQYASRAVIRHWVKEFGQVGDNFRETFHDSSTCCPAAGPPVLALVHLSVLCFAEALAIAFALLFLVSSPCGLSPVLLWLFLSERRAGMLFPSLSSHQTKFLLQGVTLRKGSPCLPRLPSGERWGQTARAGFLVPAERACPQWPERCADAAGVCLGGGNLAGIAVGSSYATAEIPVSIPFLLVNQVCISGCLSYFWSDNSRVWQDRQGTWSKQCRRFPKIRYWPAGACSARKEHIAGGSHELRGWYNGVKQDGLLLKASSKSLKSVGMFFHLLVCWGFFFSHCPRVRHETCLWSAYSIHPSCLLKTISKGVALFAFMLGSNNLVLNLVNQRLQGTWAFSQHLTS